jgi:hypothetical protein
MGNKYKFETREDLPNSDFSGQIWEELGWSSHPLKSKIFLILGYESNYAILLDLETGKRDSVHWTAFLNWSDDWLNDSWRRVA